MKKVVVLIAIFFSQICLAEEQSYLLGGGPSGGYIGLVAKSMQWKDESASLVGLSAAWAVHDRLAFGFEAQTLGNAVASRDDTVESISMNLYGMHGEVRLYDWQFLSLRAGLGAGKGSVGYRLPANVVATSNVSPYSENSLSYSALDLNIVFHLNPLADGGLGYGLLTIRDANLPGYSDDDLSGGVVSMFLRKLL